MYVIIVENVQYGGYHERTWKMQGCDCFITVSYTHLAVIRMEQALSGFTGCKGSVGGHASQK